MSRYVCSEHHLPVTWRGTGCGECITRARQWRDQRAARRAAARAKAAEQAANPMIGHRR